MIKIEVTKEMRKQINDIHREYIEQTSVLKLEEKIKKIRTKKRELFKKLFGDNTKKRKTSIINYCLSADLEDILKTFDVTFSEVYGFKFSDKSTDKQKRTIEAIRKDLDEVFNYRGFNAGIKLKNGSKWNRHKFITALGIRVCPYCNRQYISSYEDGTEGRKTTADADHYYPKEQYPILQMNIFNLVPSCNVCNSRTKGRSNKRHLYPYVDPSDSLSFQIPLELGEQVSKILIDTKINKRAETSKDVFKLDKIYQAHLEEAIEVKQNAINYFEFGERAYEALQGLDVSFDIFPTWFNFMGKDALKDPLTKLRQDIYKQVMDELKK
ncbi:MAG TPA: hypothetical protein DDW58_03350 [Clostridiaceae bacterium]|jgi:hypothetical protein|nr:hypothetical protein [Clostridiaceae bacterium]HBG38274.1 hypothetical protein [Clostridiaceae bacterium]HBN28793.1 hypothetical protein [Clostridiaceae bacterium]